MEETTTAAEEAVKEPAVTTESTATLQDKIDKDQEIIKAKRQLEHYNDILEKNNSPKLMEEKTKVQETINQRTQTLRNEALNEARNKWFAKPENINKNMADWENEGIHEEYGFDKKLKELCDTNTCEKLEFFKSQYLASKEVNAWLGLYKVTK